MPILDPSIQYSLIININKENIVENNDFFTRYLQRASIFLYKNLQTIKCLNCFKNDLKNTDKHNFSEYFGETFSIENELNDPTISNFYSKFYDKIYKNTPKTPLDVQKGTYYIFKNNLQIRFFQPIIKYSKIHSWYLTDSPIAVLCIDLTKLNDNNYYKCLSYINLEIDLISGSGFLIVLCVLADMQSSCIQIFYEKTLSTHEFSEIHFNLLHSDNQEKNLYLIQEEKYLKNSGYFYVYTKFFKKRNKSTKTTKPNIKKNPFFKKFFFSSDLTTVFKNTELEKLSKPFIYCKNGFEQNFIRILLCNVPLYDDADTYSIPSSTSGLSMAYLYIDDFFACETQRVSVLYADKMRFNRLTEKFVDFNDIHLIRPDFYVNDTLYITRLNSTTMNDIEYIQGTSNKCNSNNKVIEKIKKSYNEFVKLTKFSLHKNQIFTAYEACVALSGDEKNRFIYQVETGEGKSVIIQLIAGSLAQSKKDKKIHVVSSNINLAARDFNESYKFFQNLGHQPAVLLHKNELSYIDFTNLQIDDKIYQKLFGNDSFHNNLNMNLSACEKANIIFSTFSNFEGYYLSLISKFNTNSVKEYFKKCYLIIDEADSILIDELTHGTILSRPMMSNAQDVLIYVYNYKKKLKNENENDIETLLNEIKSYWPSCKDIEKEDINEMFREIDIVNQPEFQNGKKYSIEEIELDENKNFVRLAKNLSKKFINKNNPQNDEEDKKKTKYIIPFDYDHKGILEPNKEYNGFIQQFIAIKEINENPKEYKDSLIINDISMNYLYVSHPIFVNLYRNACGLTGTIGNKFDKKNLFDNYKFVTKVIPRNNPNYLIELPPILCADIAERNSRIVNEIIEFNKKKIPVLVILMDLTEINELHDAITSKGINNINVFDGKDEETKPSSLAGIEGAISLGTNVCGRGADIKQQSKPLHVIISYFTSNERVMKQAFGRTARQGNKGTVRIICLKNDFLSPTSTINEKEMKTIIEILKVKNKKQKEFIGYFNNGKEWIFDSSKIITRNFEEGEYKKMKEALINVNRQIAYKYKYPIIMSISTFLEIQTQKIFSLFNCPNSKYTWFLFQKYIQETILETWSLIINKVDKKYQMIKKSDSKIYTKFLDNEIKFAREKIEEYIFSIEPKNKKIELDNVSTFMQIFNRIVNGHQNRILTNFQETYKNHIINPYGNHRISINFGFKPFELIDESGARINSFDDDQKRTFIKDPELKYQRISCTFDLSITESIDSIFDMICNKINEYIGKIVGLQFFLRRTLAGCEFGLCLDFGVDGKSNIDEDTISLFDKDPIFLFTIFVKCLNEKHILAGILIIVLVYIANVLKNCFSVEGAINAIKNFTSNIFENVIDDKLEGFFSIIYDKLVEIINQQIEKLEETRKDLADLCRILLIIFHNKEFSKSGNLLSNVFNKKWKFRYKKVSIAASPSIKYIIKMGFLIILAMASFMMNFYTRQNRLKYYEVVTEDFEKNNNINLVVKKNEVKKEVLEENNNK